MIKNRLFIVHGNYGKSMYIEKNKQSCCKSCSLYITKDCNISDDYLLNFCDSICIKKCEHKNIICNSYMEEYNLILFHILKKYENIYLYISNPNIDKIYPVFIKSGTIIEIPYKVLEICKEYNITDSYKVLMIKTFCWNNAIVDNIAKLINNFPELTVSDISNIIGIPNIIFIHKLIEDILKTNTLNKEMIIELCKFNILDIFSMISNVILEFYNQDMLSNCNSHIRMISKFAKHNWIIYSFFMTLLV